MRVGVTRRVADGVVCPLRGVAVAEVPAVGDPLGEALGDGEGVGDMI